MKISEEYGSRLLRVDDIDEGQELKMVIIGLRRETMNDGKIKKVLHFHDAGFRWVLNPTNARKLAKVYGDESMDWVGRSIAISRGRTDYPNENTACLVARALPDVPRRDIEPLPEALEEVYEPPADDEPLY
jgi:hypothetical protein